MIGRGLEHHGRICGDVLLRTGGLLRDRGLHLLLPAHDHQVSPWIGLVAGGVVAALAAAAIGIPCSNLRGHYFAIASIAFAEIVRIHFNNWKLVGAAEGLTLPMLDESLRNFMFHSSKLPYYYIILAFLLLALLRLLVGLDLQDGLLPPRHQGEPRSRQGPGGQRRALPAGRHHDQRLPHRDGRDVLRPVHPLHRPGERPDPSRSPSRSCWSPCWAGRAR